MVYELPLGKGHRLSSSNAAINKFLSGWNVSSIFIWQSGEPFSILSNRGTLNRGAGSTNKNTAVALVSQDHVKDNIGVFVTGDGVFVINPSAINPSGGSKGRGVGDDAVTCNTTAFPGQLFCNPEPGQLGTLGRRVFNGQPYFNWDFSVFKKTKVTERVAVEFRTEFFNLLNHPTFFAGNQNVNSTTFGKMTSTVSDPRRIQMALRILF